MSRVDRVRLVAGVAVLLGVLAAAWSELQAGWFAPTFQAFSRLFYEQSTVAQVRAPSQAVLARWHLAIWTTLVGVGWIVHGWIRPAARGVWAVFCLGYLVRAGFWILGGNIPLVPGDSSHYVEVARSITRGEGPVKHYVESYFIDYRTHGIMDGRGVLDDWATPLWAYVLAGAYRLTGVVPGEELESTFAVAKGTSFLINVLTLPFFYGIVRMWRGHGVALASMAALAILPVHALYAGMALRESLVALISLLAAAGMVCVCLATGMRGWLWAIPAGVAGGLSILARNTSMVLVAVLGLVGLRARGMRRIGPLLLWGMLVLAVITPWAWATFREYGEPFFTYTKYYPFNFSWAVHHYDRGNVQASQFFTAQNASEIALMKVKSALIVPLFSTMILSLPLAAGFVWQFRRGQADGGARLFDRIALWSFLAFWAATLIQISDVTQVRQLGRYYLPVYVIMLPTAVSGLLGWSAGRISAGGAGWLAACLVALLWSNPAWAYDAGWYRKPFAARWPALREVGQWIREHEQEVPHDARILCWFPWELRVTSDRTTILFPRALEGGAYELKRLRETMSQYRPTHMLWGSFETMSEGDPEQLGEYLTTLRRELGLTDRELLFRSSKGMPHPVRLYRLPTLRVATGA